MTLQVPDNTKRVAVIGRTGTGKTRGGIYLLGVLKNSTWANMPITIYNPKRARFVNKLGAKEVDVNKKPPTKPGLYVISPMPGDDDAAVLQYLKRVYLDGNHGMYFDEVLDLGTRNMGYRRLLTQGRELKIPMIYCMQRPAWVDIYSLSEGDYFMIFDLRNQDDVMKVRKFAPGYNPDQLDRYYSYWYDVGSDQGAIMRPVPSEAETLRLYDPRPSTLGDRASNTRTLV